MRASMGKNKYNFNVKNIYVIILMTIDERPNKRLFYN